MPHLNRLSLGPCHEKLSTLLLVMTSFELETMTRLRAVVQDAKNEQNFTIAHASTLEEDDDWGEDDHQWSGIKCPNAIEESPKATQGSKHWDTRDIALALYSSAFTVLKV